MEKIYVANANWGRVEIVSVEIEKETAKQFQVRRDTRELIYGRSAPYIPSRLSKDSYTWSRNLDDVLASAADSLEKQRVSHQLNADSAEKALVSFRRWIEETQHNAPRSSEGN